MIAQLPLTIHGFRHLMISKKGFILIELLVAGAIIEILTAVGTDKSSII